MDIPTYHHHLQARRAEWQALRGTSRQRRADAARARSAQRWLDDDDRPAQEHRAARLHLVDDG